MSELLSIHSSNLTFSDPQQALQALQRLAKLSNSRKTNKLQYINTQKIIDATTIYEALIACRYEWFENDGHVELLGACFGSEDEIFNKIAPYVENGSFIECYTGTRGVWRYYFIDGKLEMRYAQFGATNHPLTHSLQKLDPFWEWSLNKEESLFSFERAKYGFDSRETYSLDHTFYIWLYERLKRYVEIAKNVINLEFHEIEYNGVMHTQLEWINIIFERIEFLYSEEYEETDENVRYTNEIASIFAVLLPYLWR